MNNTKATYVATCHPFIASESILKRRRLARQAKGRRDPGSLVIMENLVKDISTAIVSFAPPADLQLATWFGTADRLAYVHPSGVLDLLGAETAKNETCEAIQFVTAVGPRSYWPQEEAKSYRDAVVAFRLDSGDADNLAHAAKALVVAARHRESAWSRDEWQYRMMAAIAAWIYWDDEPGAARDAAQHAT